MKFNSRQYSLMSFSVLIALSGTTHAATTYMDARNDAMGGIHRTSCGGNVCVH